MTDPTWELKSLQHELATARARIAELEGERDRERRRKEFERREHHAASAENTELRAALERMLAYIEHADLQGESFDTILPQAHAALHPHPQETQE